MSADEGDDGMAASRPSREKNHNKYRKDKPWDNAEIDHWKIEEWNPDELPAPLLEESSFATLFPKYREKYLRDVWPVVTKALDVSTSHSAVVCAANATVSSNTHSNPSPISLYNTHSS